MLGVIGDIVQDVVVWQHEPLRRATDTHAHVTVHRGGSAANVAALAGPRYPTRFIGCVGDDLAGSMLRRDLEERGVDVRTQVGEHSGVIVVLIDETGERTMFPSRGACTQLRTVDPSWLDGLEILHVTAYSFESGSTVEAVLAAARAVRERGGRVSLDVSSVGTIERHGSDEFLDIMRECAPDFISANRDECALLRLADGAVPGRGLRHFPDAVLLAHAGAHASHVLVDGECRATVPVPPAPEVRDLTGAGDAFNAGFLTNYLTHGWQPARNVAAAHALARRVLHTAGAGEQTED